MIYRLVFGVWCLLFGVCVWGLGFGVWGLGLSSIQLYLAYPAYPANSSLSKKSPPQ
jgi:hypothetical protein